MLRRAMHHGVRARRASSTHVSSFTPLPAGLAPGRERGDSLLDREPPLPSTRARGRTLEAQRLAHHLEALAGGEILAAVAAARALRPVASADERVAAAAVRLVHNGDLLAAMLALDALAWARWPQVERTLVEALSEPDLAEHAAWALTRREPVAAAIPPLAHLIAAGTFTAMPAQLALEAWSRRAPDGVRVEIGRALARSSNEGGWSRLVETLSIVNDPPPPSARTRSESFRAGRRRALSANGTCGLRVAQVLLRGRVDAELVRAGSSDGGGVVTLLVQLARELGLQEGIERSTIIARPSVSGSAEAELLGPNASIVRLPFGPTEDVPVGAMWEHRVQIERAVTEAITAEPIDVAQLRYADAGTFAAARALRRAGVAVVFTVAPDPHGLIHAGERRGRLTRRSFADAERREHNLFRLRLVDELTADADRLVTLPRAGGLAATEELLGRSLDRRRTASIPEGIALARPSARADASSPFALDLAARIAALGSGRVGLPLIVSVGRFHPVKGFPRLVEAWAGDGELAARFNLVLVGGDLEHPTADEREVLHGIELALGRHPAARAGLVLLGARPHADVERLLSIARHGLVGVVSPGGTYACASAKEEFGVSILEALASGLAVVAPDGGGPATYLDEDVAGVLVEPGRVDTLRAGLRHAARLVLDEDRAARGAALVRSRFSIAPMAATLADTYREAVREACR
jgi:glycosyltransferase involved in cell wall biosynthesis